MFVVDAARAVFQGDLFTTTAVVGIAVAVVLAAGALFWGAGLPAAPTLGHCVGRGCAGAAVTGTTLDTGALLALQAGSRRMVALVETALRTGSPLAVPAGVLAQAGRGGARQARIGRLPRVTATEVSCSTGRRRRGPVRALGHGRRRGCIGGRLRSQAAAPRGQQRSA